MLHQGMMGGNKKLHLRLLGAVFFIYNDPEKLYKKIIVIECK